VQDNQLYCPFDYTFHGYPNVKFAQRDRQALEERVTRVIATVGQETAQKLRDFAARTQAVINVSPMFLRSFLYSRRALYAPYRKQLQAGIRTPAEAAFDKERAAAEAELFGTEVSVIHAALAVRGQGLTSYGSVALRLDSRAIEGRASLLDENSFTFCRKYRRPFPPGHLATWETRGELVLALFGERLAALPEDDFASLLLFSEGDRETDRFVEVHIWGEFPPEAIATIEVLADPADEFEEFDLALAKRAAVQSGIEWRDREETTDSEA
jgi:hypothetical protein